MTSLVPSGKSRLDLDFVQHLGNAIHDLGAPDHMGRRLHQIGNAATVARPLDDEVADQRHRLRVVELDATLAPPPRHLGRHGDQQLVLLARR